MITITIPKNDVIDFLKSRNYTNEAALLEYIQSSDFCQMAIGVIRNERETTSAVGTMSALQDLRITVCKALNISENDMQSKRRFREVTDARKIYCYIAWKYTLASFKLIGKTIGKDHSTVIHAKNECMILGDKEFVNNVKYVEKMVGIQYSPVIRMNKDIYNMHKVKKGSSFQN